MNSGHWASGKQYEGFLWTPENKGCIMVTQVLHSLAAKHMSELSHAATTSAPFCGTDVDIWHLVDLSDGGACNERYLPCGLTDEAERAEVAINKRFGRFGAWRLCVELGIWVAPVSAAQARRVPAGVGGYP